MSPVPPVIVSVSGEEAAAHGLPPVAVRADATNCGMFLVPFSPGCYVRLQGPPGAPLSFVVRPGDRRGDDPVPLEEQVRRRESSSTDLELGPSGPVKVHGVERPALLYYAGHSSASRACCVVRLEVGPVDVVLELTVSSVFRNVPSCASVGASLAFRRLLDSFEAAFEPPPPKPHPRRRP